MALGTAVEYAFVAGDTNSVLSVTCRRADTLEVIDLTGATVTLRYRIEDGTVQSKTMTVASPVTGVATYTFGAAELTAGQMVAEVEIVQGGKLISSLEFLLFHVREKV